MSKENINGDYNEGGNLLEKNDHSADLQIRKTGCSPRKGETFLLTDVVAKLETVAERRMRRYSHYVVYCTTFIMSIGFSIILTGVWPYLKQLDPTASKEYLGWVIAANPIGQMLFSPVLGWWANRVGSTRIAFVLTILLSISGSAMYALLPLMGTYASYLIFVSRFIVGLSGANIAICRSYIVASTKLKERTSALAGVAAAQAIGFILGPSLQAALIFMEDTSQHGVNVTSLANSTDILAGEAVNEIFGPYAMTGWIGVFLGVLNLQLFFPCIFKESSLAAKEVEMKSKDKSSATFHQKINYWAIFVILFVIFNIVLIFVLIETLLVPMCMDLYAWTGEEAVRIIGIVLTIAGIASFFIFILSGYLAKRFDERKLFIYSGLIPMAISMLLFFPLGNRYPLIKYCNGTIPLDGSYNSTVQSVIKEPITEFGCDAVGCPAWQEWCFYTPILSYPQLILASIFCTIGYPMCMSLSNAIFSKMLGFRPQAFWMGLLSGVSSFSRAAGPIFVTFMYTSYGTRWTFGFLFCVVLFVITLTVTFFKGLASMQILTDSHNTKTDICAQNGNQKI